MNENMNTSEYYEEEEGIKTAIKNVGRWIISIFYRALKRGVLIYVNPLKVFEEVKNSPDIVPPLLLLLTTLVFSTSMVFALIEGIRVHTNGMLKEIIPQSEYLTIYVLKGVGFFGLWLLTFIIFWILMYLLRADIDSYAIFSASGYLYSSMLPIYALLFVLYKVVAISTPNIIVAYTNNILVFFSEENLKLNAIYLRINLASKALGLPIYILINFLLWWFPLLWESLLSVFLIRKIGKTSWVKTIVGGTIAILLLTIVRSILQSMGFF